MAAPHANFDARLAMDLGLLALTVSVALAVLMSRTAESQVLLQSASNLDVADSLPQRVFQTNAQRSG